MPRVSQSLVFSLRLLLKDDLTGASSIVPWEGSVYPLAAAAGDADNAASVVPSGTRSSSVLHVSSDRRYSRGTACGQRQRSDSVRRRPRQCDAGGSLGRLAPPSRARAGLEGAGRHWVDGQSVGPGTPCCVVGARGTVTSSFVSMHREGDDLELEPGC